MKSSESKRRAARPLPWGRESNDRMTLASDEKAIPVSDDDYLRCIYHELRSLAGRLMRHERPEHTLQPTDLVHEVISRMLERPSRLAIDDRGAVFAFVAQAMRRVLVDHARRRAANKRCTGNGRRQWSLDTVLTHFESSERVDLLRLEDALLDLQAQSPRQHEIVVLRFFGGLKYAEIATHLHLALSTVEKDWRFARCWLLDHMRRDDDERT